MDSTQTMFAREGLRARNRPISTDERSTTESEPAIEVPKLIFESNDKGLVDNPLISVKHHEAETIARQFARDHDLGHLEDVFGKAGRLAKDRLGWQSVPNLTNEEQVVLESELRKGFSKQPKPLKIAILTLAVAAIVQGWNQTASNGANLNWPKQLGLHVTGCDPHGEDAWIFATVNAATYFAASLVGCWLSDPLNEIFWGRRVPIALSATLILASIIGASFTRTWQELLVCRILLGVGMGCKASVVPVFAAELAPSHIRGSLVMNWQLFDALGIFLGFTANLVVSQTGRIAWRLQTASSVIPTIVLLSLIYPCTESPRFLMKRGRFRAAYDALVLLRGHAILAATELFYVHCQMLVEAHFMSMRSEGEHHDVERESRANRETKHTLMSHFRIKPRASSAQSVNYWQRWRQLFTVPRNQRALCAAVVCMISQQLCGVNVLAFYSSTLFCDASKQAGNTADPSYLKPLFLSWGIGLSNFVFAFPAYWLIDARGRRWLLLVALPFMSLTMLAAGLSFLIPKEGPRGPVIGVFTYLFMFFYSWSMGPVPFTLSAEVFPLDNRVAGMSVAVFVNLFGAGVLTLIYPTLTLKMGHAGLLGLFAGFNVIAFFLVFFYVRETSGAAIGSADGSMNSVSLEELNYIFGVSTKMHKKYQRTKVLPWVWQNLGSLLLLKKVDPPEKCCSWAIEQTQELQEKESPLVEDREV